MLYVQEVFIPLAVLIAIVIIVELLWGWGSWGWVSAPDGDIKDWSLMSVKGVSRVVGGLLVVLAGFLTAVVLVRTFSYVEYRVNTNKVNESLEVLSEQLDSALSEIQASDGLLKDNYEEVSAVHASIAISLERAEAALDRARLGFRPHRWRPFAPQAGVNLDGSEEVLRGHYSRASRAISQAGYYYEQIVNMGHNAEGENVSTYRQRANEDISDALYSLCQAKLFAITDEHINNARRWERIVDIIVSFDFGQDCPVANN